VIEEVAVALRQISEEQIIVSTASIGITSTLLVDANGNTVGIIHADFQHRSGGIIQINAQTAPAADGSVGIERTIGDEWRVIGFEDLKNFRMIKQTGESDAVVNVTLFGAP
tara:strand:+ start:268 stop:600 length:333 start_codon:yes stop_codon:yes gene_type:complete